MLKDKNALNNMSASEYVKYLEDNFLFKRVRVLGDKPWRAIGLLINLVKLGLKPQRAKDTRMVSDAFSLTALRDIFECNLKAIIRSLPRDEGTSRLESIPVTCIPQDIQELELTSPNALAVLTPRGDPYILIHAGLSYCLHSVTKALTHCIETGSSGDEPINLPDLKRFVNSVAHYFKTGDAAKLGFLPFRTTESTLLLQSLLGHGEKVFLLWHELAHHILGHVGQQRKVRLSTTPQFDVTLVSREQKEELAADIIGAKFTYHTFEFYADKSKATAAGVPVTSAPHVYAAPDVFFTFLAAFEKILGRNWSPRR